MWNCDRSVLYKLRFHWIQRNLEPFSSPLNRLTHIKPSERCGYASGWRVIVIFIEIQNKIKQNQKHVFSKQFFIMMNYHLPTPRGLDFEWPTDQMWNCDRSVYTNCDFTGINATLNPFSSPLNRLTHIKSSERCGYASGWRMCSVIVIFIEIKNKTKTNNLFC